MRWLWQVFSTELRTILTYRVDFWIGFLGTVLSELSVAFFLWKAIFLTQGISEVGGWSFPALMLYYSVVPLIARMARGSDLGFIAGEIFDGSLTRYLVWPIPIFPYKYAKALAQSCVYGIQVLAALGVFLLVVGMPEDSRVTVVGVVGGLTVALAGSLVYFLMASTLELVAFWAENVWSLNVMLRFMSNLLGGGMIPLTLYPRWAQPILHYLPFEHLISLPARCVVGRASLSEWLFGVSMLMAWSFVVSIICAWVWSMGTRQYTGTGQ